MTSLINIPDHMRQRINDRLYTAQLCIEHIGMANPGPSDIRKFKEGWKLDYTMPITNITNAQKVLKEQGCPPLLYDIRTNNWDWNGPGGMPEWWGDTYGPDVNRYIVFYEEEDYILFKLLYKNT